MAGFKNASMGLLVVSIAACGTVPDGETPAETPSAVQEPIIGGSNESGWPAVGALTYYLPGQFYGGAFCTASLIDSRWLLTAGHCVTGDGSEPPPEPSSTYFFMGPDANNPSNGTFHAVQSFHKHPNYPADSFADLALVRLWSPVSGVTPLPYNASLLGQSYVGDFAHYVGYGVSNGATQTGGGVKRSTDLQIVEVFTNTYTSDNGNPAICFGDSGGPGLMQLGGTWKIIGVNSTVSGTNCIGYANHVKVDYFSTFIANTMSGAANNCNTDPSLCVCAAACNANGTCTNGACEIKNCREIYECTADCGTTSACYNSCYLQGTTAGKQKYDAMVLCWSDHCANASDFQACVDSQCSAQTDGCFAFGTGTASCGDSYNCLNGCANADCQNTCLEAASAGAYQDLIDMFDCWDTCTPTTSQCIESNCNEVTQNCIGDRVEGNSCQAAFECVPGLVCEGITARRCFYPCNPSAPVCPAPGQICVELAPREGYCDPPGGTGCACDVTTNVCDPFCGCDEVCNPSCACDDEVGCDAGCNCDAECPDFCPCDNNAACVAACFCDNDCPCACDTSARCESGCSCDPDCVYGCACNNDPTCEAGCGCDSDCAGACTCDVSGLCDAGCNDCDPDCNVACACDTGGGCQAGCSCDDDCGGTCACDVSAGCDVGCACDPVCSAGCTCNTSLLCDGGCGCDVDCADPCACDLTASCDLGCACDGACGSGGSGGTGATGGSGGAGGAGGSGGECSCDDNAGYCDPDPDASGDWAACGCDDDCPCECDATFDCDQGCSCDIDCLGKSSSGCAATGSDESSAGVLALLGVLYGIRRRRLR